MRENMKKTLLLAAIFAAASPALLAGTLDITSFRYCGPVKVLQPFLVDSVNVAGTKIGDVDILDTPVSLEALRKAPVVSALPECDSTALHIASFCVETMDFAKVKFKAEGAARTKVLLDGKPLSPSGEASLEPGTHEFAVKFTGPADSLKFSLDAPESVCLRNDGTRILSLDIDTQGAGLGGVSISPSGKFYTVTRAFTDASGKRTQTTELFRASDGTVLSRSSEKIEWMPARDAYYYTRERENGRDLIVCNPDDGSESVLAADIPEGWFSIAPTEDYLIYSLEQEGPKEGEVHQILVPDDRQPGWRDRSYLARYDIASGVLQDITFGFHNAWLSDISDDGSRILFSTQTARLEKRPTSLSSLYLMDIRTLQTKCLVDSDGFVMDAQFSPDGTKVLVTGGAEAFGRIGCTLPEDLIPNGVDNQLFLLDIADGSVKPLTRDFDPNVEKTFWSRWDGKIYMTVEDRDRRNIYRLDPASGKTERLPSTEEYINGIDVARTAPALIYSGESLCNGDRAYLMDLKKGRQQLVRDLHAERLGDVVLGEGLAYEFTSSRGDLINGFYVLPPHFDPSKKYPLLVHYYGGCSPTLRYCIGSYSPQMYAAQGYVFYVINPSGASGFGQEFASRHVNTAGDVVADDIIEGTLKFCEDHPFVDSSRIGCFSASYGGVMTQLLLSKTDIYTTGISHAGISDHTSYWGEGYWGYSYSEISMSDSYPWTRKDLYVDRSPLYFADRIKSPLLFLHGSADTNVPIGESIQMFTALKLIGTPTAFVVVDGENHGIADYAKKRQWLRTIFAWFSKYLKDDPTWWEELYPEKNL